MNINGYEIIGELNHENSGFSKWGFCKKAGKRFFIKEFLSPTYPIDTSKLSEKQVEKKILECREFERKLLRMYKMINSVSDGNVVRIQEFFRCNSKYYIVTDEVNHSNLTVEQILMLPYHAKKFICKVVVHAMLKLHNMGFVHADIKPNNILVTADKTRKKYTAKIIDFDCGFYGTEPPELGEELNGDPVYFAPEVILHMMEEDVALSCKIDVFSLGILFHQYMTGKLPIYDENKYSYVSEAVLDGSEIGVDSDIPTEFASLLKKMLIKEPSARISLKDVYANLTTIRKKTETSETTSKKTDTTLSDSNIKVYRGNK